MLDDYRPEWRQRRRGRETEKEKEIGEGKVLTRSSRARPDSVEHVDRRARSRDRACLFFDVRCLARERRAKDEYVMSEVMDNVSFIIAVLYAVLKRHVKTASSMAPRCIQFACHDSGCMYVESSSIIFARAIVIVRAYAS